MEWQPIETAPKDGTSVLLYGECDGEIHGRFGRKSISVGSFRYRAWSVDDTDAYSVIVHATHWMPLPQPPALIEALQAAAREAGDE